MWVGARLRQIRPLRAIVSTKGHRPEMFQNLCEQLFHSLPCLSMRTSMDECQENEAAFTVTWEVFIKSDFLIVREGEGCTTSTTKSSRCWISSWEQTEVCAHQPLLAPRALLPISFQVGFHQQQTTTTADTNQALCFPLTFHSVNRSSSCSFSGV